MKKILCILFLCLLCAPAVSAAAKSQYSAPSDQTKQTVSLSPKIHEKKVKLHKGKISSPLPVKNVRQSQKARPPSSVNSSSVKINLVWQHANSPSVDLSSLEKVPGVNVVSPCWYVIENEFGKLTDNSVAGYTKKAREKGYKVWPLITNGFDPDRTRKLLADENAKRFVIAQLQEQAEKHGFDGINLDFENIYPEDKEELTVFVRQIRKATQPAGLVLSMDVTVPDGSPMWSLCFDRKALAAHLDYMMLMAYDQYSVGSRTAGPTASFNWDEDRLQATLKEVPSEKLLLGLPLYMRLWHYDADEKRFRAKTLSMPQAESIWAEKHTDITFRQRWLENEKMTFISYMEEGVPYCYWQEDLNSLSHKAGLVNTYKLAGIASWRYGFETQDIWPMLRDKLAL